MPKIVAVHGSPRRGGNTWLLLEEAIKGAESAGAEVQTFILRDMKISPCLEIYGCRKAGRCVIKDDFQTLFDAIMEADGLMLASPIFFYAVSAHTKIMMDRFQSLWVKRYWIEEAPFKGRAYKKRGIFISAGATRGKKLFDGAVLSAQYLFDPLDMEMAGTYLFRGLDHKGEVKKHPEYLEECFQGGVKLAESLPVAQA